MLKRVILLTVIIALVFTLTASALSGGVSIELGKDFVTTSNQNNLKKIAGILNMGEEELTEYLSNNGIAFLGVNEDNTKQVKIVCTKSSFSEGVGNLSGLTDGEIEKIAPSVIGNQTDKFTLVSKGSQRLIKINYSDKDSGGKYSITSYITVADGTNYILSFYTAKGINKGYIEKAFKTYTCSSFAGAKSSAGAGLILGVAVVLAIIAAYIIYTLLRDLKTIIDSKKVKNL